MPNAYADLSMLKGDARISGSTDDDARLRALESASREIDQRTHRHFYSRVGVAYPRWFGTWDADPRVLLVDLDIISLSALGVDAAGSGAYDLALVEGVDYRLLPLNRLADEPARMLELLRTGSQLGSWLTYSGLTRLTGKFGYNEAVEQATAVNAVGGISAVQTTIVVDDATATPRGSTIVIGSEQMFVRGVSSNTLTVTRGMNGTTAASAADDAVVYKRRYPEDIEAACVLRAVDRIRGAQQGYSGQAGGDGMGFASNTAYAQFRGLIEPYIIPVAA